MQVASIPQTLIDQNAILGVFDLLQNDPTRVSLPSHGLVVTAADCGVIKSHLQHHLDVEYLDLSGSPLGEEGIQTLCEAIEGGGAHALRYVGLSNTGLTAAALASLMAALRGHAKQLCGLDVSYNDLGDSAVEDLVLGVPHCLDHLNVAGNQLGGEGIAQLLRGLLRRRVPLAVVDLSHNRLTPRAAEALRALLNGPAAETLRELRLRHCGINDVTSPLVAEGVSSCAALEVLKLAENDCVLGFAASTHSGLPVAMPDTLRVLDLSRNPIHPATVEGLCGSLELCLETLEELSLSGTLLDDASLAALLTGLHALPQLRAVDLSSNRLSYRSGRLLGQLLSVHEFLERVVLTDNLLEVEGIEPMTASIERMKFLKVLHLGSCRLGNCGAVSVVTSLIRSTSPVEQLDLSNNYITDAGVMETCSLLSRLTSPHLLLLELSGNSVSAAAGEKLRDMLEGRQSGCRAVLNGTEAGDSLSENGSHSAGESRVEKTNSDLSEGHTA